MAARKVKFANGNASDRYSLESKYKNTRYNLLLVIVFTVINIVLPAVGSDTYFLFSACIPYTIVVFGMAMCGKYPLEYYGGGDMSDYNFQDPSYFAGFVALAVILTALYILPLVFSNKNRYGWLIFALVLFVIDTLFMIGYVGFAADMLLDYLFHVWVIGILIVGISTGKKLKKLPPEEEEIEGIELPDEAEPVTVSADPEE